jgi:hypothetical protein
MAGTDPSLQGIKGSSLGGFPTNYDTRVAVDPWIEIQGAGGKTVTFPLDHLPKVGGIMLGRAIEGPDDVQRAFGRDQLESAISRRHARLFAQDGGIYIEDVGSKNGTRVNGTVLMPSTPVLLQNRDRISLAQVVFLTFHNSAVAGEEG